MSKLLLLTLALISLVAAERSRQFQGVVPMSVFNPGFPEPCYSGACVSADPFNPWQVGPRFTLIPQAVVAATPEITVTKTEKKDPCADPCEKPKKEELKDKRIDVEVKISHGQYAGISLPPPPRPDFSLAEESATVTEKSKCPCVGSIGCTCVVPAPAVLAIDPAAIGTSAELSFQAELARQQIDSKALSQKLDRKEKSLDEQVQWLMTAQKAQAKLTRQIADVNQTKSLLESEVTELRNQKEALKKTIHRTVLEHDLDIARASLQQLESKEKSMKGTGSTLNTDAGRLKSRIQQLHERLNKVLKNYSLLQGGTAQP